jgi:hypothetical protein
MNHSFPKVTTLEALSRTIIYDKATYGWVTLLLSRKTALERVLGYPHYPAFKKRLILQTMLLILSIGLLFVALTIYPSLLLLDFPLIILFFGLNKKIRQDYSQMMLRLIKEDFQETELGQKTLYQIGEYYSQRYKIPSLVDLLTAENVVIKYILIFVFGLFIATLPVIELQESALMVGALLFAVVLLKNTGIFYRCLKNF